MSELRRLGRYVLVEALARGGMGEVWLARPEDVPGAPKLCVVKTLREGLVADAEARVRFVDESRVALLLSHPCICRTVDAGTVGETLYIALEVVEGIDVRQLAARAREAGRPVDQALALWIVGCAADGLAFAHEAAHPLTGAPLGIVHRDISPHNLMCAADGTVRIIDFGLALSSLKEARTERDVVLGKLAYMAPEQATGGRLDARADVFALGVVLYELLSGERYWGELKHDEIWRRAGLATWVPTGLSRLDGDVGAVVASAIAGKVEKRTPSAARLRDDIARLLASRGGADAAARRLGALVQDLAGPELERIRAAQAGTDTLPPDQSSPVMSIALEEVRAIEAMLQRAAPPPPTLRLSPTTLAELLGPATAAPAPTLELPVATPSGPTAPAPRPRRRAPVGLLGVAAAGILVAVIGAAALLRPRAEPGAGTDPMPVAQPLLPPPVPTLPQRPPPDPVPPDPVRPDPMPPDPMPPDPIPAGPVPSDLPPLVDATADADAPRPQPKVRLSTLLKRLDGCDAMCARTLRSTTRDVDRLSGAEERDARKLIVQCLASCR